MKRYFLILYSDDLIMNFDNMFNDLQSVANTKKVKWLYPDEGNSLIFHFETSINVSELKELTYLTFCQYSTFFILTELTENDMLGMPKESLEHLLSLDNEPVDFEHNPTIEEVEQILEDITIDNEIDPEILSMKLLSTVKTNCKIPTLNDLLDKMLETGFDSLTSNEKQLLDNYSNK